MNKIIEIRKLTKLSQSKFSSKYNIPLKTLQKWEQGISKPADYLVELLEFKINFDLDIDVDKYKIKYTNHFDCVIDDKFLNINRIHPIMQKRVRIIIDELSKYAAVKKIVIFGSSITHKCNHNSDIDIYVELSKNMNVRTFIVDCPVDFWTNYSIEPDMLNEVKLGAVVYINK